MRHLKIIKHRKFDGMIITGAPVEKMDFDAGELLGRTYRRLWSGLKHILRQHFISAGRHRRDYIIITGLKKVQLEKKLSGVYRHHVMNKKEPLVRGFDDFFMAPHSRYTEGLPGGYFKLIRN